jgi:NifU-like protein involved in Fe-S cluster formation
VTEPLYNSLVRELFSGAEPASCAEQHRGQWLVGESGSVALGTWVRLKVEIQGARVMNTRFRVYGCPHTVAATAWVARQIRGRPTKELLPEGIARLCEPLEVPAEKLGRLLVIEDVVRVCERQAGNV